MDSTGGRGRCWFQYYQQRRETNIVWYNIAKEVREIFEITSLCLNVVSLHPYQLVPVQRLVPYLINSVILFNDGNLN